MTGGTKWRLKDLHIINGRVVRRGFVESIRDSKVVLLRGDSSSGEWSLPFPMSIAIKAAEVERPTNQATNTMDHSDKDICSVFCSLYSTPEVIPPRSRAFHGTVREVTSLVGSHRLLSPHFCVRPLPAGDICRYIFAWARIDRPECQPALPFTLER